MLSLTNLITCKLSMKCCYINKIWSGAVLEVIQGNRSLMVALAQQLLLIIFSLKGVSIYRI